MIILTKNNETIEIPNYDDLDNKPKINGVTLEGDLSSADLGIEVDASDFYTKSQSDNRFQPKGNYLTAVPSEYVTETELNEAIAGLGAGGSVAYLIIKENVAENTYSYVGGSFEDVVNAYNNNKPYFIYVPNGAGTNYYSLAETTIITDTYIQCLSFAHTGVTHTWRYWRLYLNSATLYNQTTYEYATTSRLNSKQNTLVSGTNIKTINGESILGSGDLTIEAGSGGTTDLSNYYTKTEIDTQIGDIYTILENIIG